MKTKATAFAPATVANVAVGFDILGFPLEEVGDRVSVSKLDMTKKDSSVIIKEIVTLDSSNSLHSLSSIPLNPAANTATVGLLQMVKDLKLDFGFQVSIQKGIPLSSGMGGSAASAVAAIVAANSLLESSLTLTQDELLQYALMGEKMASGSAHLDNVAPSFLGGLTLILSLDPIKIISIPVPKEILCVLVHPHISLDTRESRAILKSEVSLSDHTKQSAKLAGLIAGCFKNDLKLIAESLSDILIEPQRAPLIPGFERAKMAALQTGAIGCSISGSGPSLFAWVDSHTDPVRVGEAISSEFKKVGLESDKWISPISQKGARVIS